MAVHWFRLCASNAGDTGSVPSWETKIPYAVEHNPKKKKIAFTLFLLDVYNMLRRKLGVINSFSGEENIKVQRDGGT